MIEKTKIKLKQGVACLLAALQVSVVAGCSSKTYKEEYSDAVATIEQLEKEIESLQNNLDKNSIYEDRYNEALTKIKQLEDEKNALLDELNQKDDKEDSEENIPNNDKENNNLTNDLTAKLGIDESILANSDIKNALKKLADYLDKQPNLKADNFADTHQIFFYSDGSLKGQIHFSDTTRSFVVTLYYEGYSESTEINLYGNDYPSFLNETNYIMNSKVWDFENNTYILSEKINNEGQIYRREIEKDVEDKTTDIILSKAAGMYNIAVLKYNWSDNQITDREFWRYTFSDEDYQTLSDLIDNYKNGNELGDAIDYIKDALLNALEKWITEDEYTELKNILDNEKVLVRDK